MALSFPSDPINGAVSGEYTYDATKGAWRKNAALPVSVTHSDVAPSSPREGDQWWKSNEGTLFTYYNDGTSSQWVESTNVVASSDPNPIPAGAMMAWASDVIPANWLLCDGTAVSRSTYASLFAAIGTAYGAGDGTTTFNLPNLKGKTIVGKDSSQTEFDTLGETGGAKTHTLTESELPSHTHSNTLSNATVASSSHRHNFAFVLMDKNWSPAGQNAGMDSEAANVGGAYKYSNNTYNGGTSIGTHTTNINTNINSGSFTSQVVGRYRSIGDTDTPSATTTVGITNGAAGSGSAHNNLQPYIVLNYIIKFSAGETPGDSQLAVRVGTLETQNNATPLSANYIINGGFDIWQRGTSLGGLGAGAANLYSADRWESYRAGYASGMSAYRVDSDLPGFRYFARVFRDNGNTGTQALYFNNPFETSMIAPLRGKTVTASFYVRKGENYSASGNVLVFQADSGTGTESGTRNGFTSQVTVATQNITLTSSWQRVTNTFVVPANSTQFALRFIHNPVGTAGTFDCFDITGVQLEEGSYATPFRRNASSIQAELAVCQRYYYRYTEAVNYAFLSSAMCWGGNEAVIAYKLPVTMRVRPSASISNLAGVYWLGNGTNYTGATNFNSYTTPETWGMYCTITIPANTPLMFRLPLNAYIEANAEI